MELYQDTWSKNTKTATSPDGPHWPPSVEGSPEQQPHSGALGVIGGSLPVPASDILRVASALEDNASTRETVVGSRLPLEEWEGKALHESAALRYCAVVLKRHAEYIRRQVEHEPMRQPEENKAI
jgi:hypothetical protein